MPNRSASGPRQLRPEELFYRSAPRVVVKQAGSFIESARVRRPSETKLLAIEMVAELVAQLAQERAEGRNLLAHGGASPDADERIFKRVITEKLDLPSTLPHAERSSGQGADLGSPHVVKGSCCIQEFGAGRSNLGRRAFLHYRFDHLSQIWELWVGRQFDAGKLFALEELTQRFATTGRPICNHLGGSKAKIALRAAWREISINAFFIFQREGRRIMSRVRRAGEEFLTRCASSKISGPHATGDQDAGLHPAAERRQHAPKFGGAYKREEHRLQKESAI